MHLVNDKSVLKQNYRTVSLKKNNTRIDFLETGDILQFLGGDILINQLLGNNIDGSANNIYMRIHKDEEVISVPLLGIKSNSKFYHNEEEVAWTGEFENIEYKVTFTLANESIWFWSIDAKGNGEKVDFIYAQDISVANKGATLTNELYMSQYLDNKVIKGDNGYVVSSRQNQSQGGRFPYLQQGSLNTNIVGYSTDGMQFFGKEYKLTNTPKALKTGLENYNYQFELSYTALQSEKLTLTSDVNVVFYGVFKENYEKAVEKIEFTEDVKNAFEEFKNKSKNDLVKATTIKVNSEFETVLVSEEMTEEEIQKYFPIRTMEEKCEEKTLSFFTPNHTHVVLQAKELMVERPHGHIITNGVDTKKISEGLMTSTTYMYGIFNCQMVAGNTTLNKLLSTSRGLLNIMKNSGQRIYVKVDNKFRLLTLPAAYEIGVNFTKWYYKLNDDMITVVSYASKEKSDIILEVNSNNKYEFLITNQLVMGSSEFEQPVNIERKDNSIKITPFENTFLVNTYKEINYKMNILGTEFSLSDDRIFFEDGISRNGSLMTIKTSEVDSFKIVTEGRLTEDNCESELSYSLEEEIIKFDRLYDDLTCGFELSLERDNSEVEKINEIFWWYTHNALTHYAVPHGLEQPGGAAWGTRDVFQRTMEYFLKTQKYELSKEIILEIFAHQFLENGEWPQWFMFDKYNMQQDDCHGDVVFWPLKALSDYISITGDDFILYEEVEYRHFPHGEKTEKETILSHVKRALESIRERFLLDTALINYAGGDWDDTLQPANKALAQNLVSAWTVSLAYQTIKQLSKVTRLKEDEFSCELEKMSLEIKDAFDKYLVKDDIIAGFAYCEDKDNIEYMLHPEDKKTGIQYRLLPMTRSIISELVDLSQANKNVELIEKHLKCPDGVRLMNKPATYKGGVIEFFQRAEQASNVGREIGLQYVHAHIRYVEAMAKLGKSTETWNSLLKINPINIKEQVENAEIRQSNTYFSSSDGDFKTRYEYQENFDKLRSGEVKVKGGWRIYSSGPGIYLNQLISNVLGFRLTSNEVVIDPILPKKLDGLKFNYRYKDKNIKITYNIETEDGTIDKILVNGTEVLFEKAKNPYRIGGANIDKILFESYLSNENNTIEVFLG